MRTPGFYTFEDLEEMKADYRYKKWCISILNVVGIEIEQLFSDENWEKVFEFSKELIGENFSGEIARQIHIFGDPKHAHEEHRMRFLPSEKHWRSHHHFQVC
jgi:hypothetical protein